MFKKFREYFRLRQIGTLLQKTYRLIFSEKFDLKDDKQREDVIKNLTLNKKNKELLDAYYIIKIALSQIRSPRTRLIIKNNEINETLSTIPDLIRLKQTFALPKKKKKNFDEAIEAFKSLQISELKWELSLVNDYLTVGRKACHLQENSVEKLRYIKEKKLNRPLTLEEQQIHISEAKNSNSI